MKPSNAINGLVLSGGRSTRMSVEKGLISYHGKPQREFLFELLSQYCAKVLTSCKTPVQISSKLNPLPDRFEMEGPLNGILTAFELDSTNAWLVLPVDMPLIDTNVIDFLLLNRNPEKMATCFLDSTGEDPEPLFALWEPMAGEALMDYYARGGKSPREFLRTHDVALLTVPDAKYLININSSVELAAFLKSYMKTD
jgi:molybdenum cofactor guanylyltransferase